ncbi:MAG: TRAP transporter small permease [Desulfobacterales bacterium]
MERFRKLIRKASTRSCFAGMLLLAPLMTLTVADVVGRSFFNKPIPGTFELSEYMLAVIVLLGAAYTQQVKGHVAVGFFTERCSPRARAALNALTGAASLFVVAIVVWQGAVTGIDEKSVSDQLRIPQWPFRLLVAAGGLLLWLELALDLIDSVRSALGGSRWIR